MATSERSVEGAKASRAVINAFHARLNSSELVPEQAFRRNSSAYPLVCYLNNIAGLFLSKNYDPIPVFIARAAEHMQNSPPSAASRPYYDFATRYLSQVAYHLRSYIEGIEHWDERIPVSLLEAGPQDPS